MKTLGTFGWFRGRRLFSGSLSINGSAPDKPPTPLELSTSHCERAKPIAFVRLEFRRLDSMKAEPASGSRHWQHPQRPYRH